MTAWTSDELARIGAAEEVQIAPLGPDGTLLKPVTVWLVRHGDGLYVRSAVKGRDAAWFRAVQETHGGQVRTGKLARDVTFTTADHDLDDQVDAAYRTKYRRYAGRILNTCLTPDARSTTLELVPRSARQSIAPA